MTEAGQRNLKLLIAGGGTGGHVFPALAIAREWMSRGAEREVVFVGTQRGIEARLVPEAGFPLETIRSAGLKGIGGMKLARNVAKLVPAMWDSFAILRRHKFAAALGVGGYAAGPVMLAAVLRGLPTVVFEPNAEPGFTNRVLARMATRIATAYEAPTKLWGRKATLTGIPVRPEFFAIAAARAGRAVSYPDYRRQPGRARHQPHAGGLRGPAGRAKKSHLHRSPDRRTRL